MLVFWLTVILVFLGSLLPSVIKWVMLLAFKADREEVELRKQLVEMTRELAGISAVDEFARYARLKRKINKAEEALLGKGQSRMDLRESIKWKFTKICQIIIGAALVYIAVTMRYEPVLLGLPDWFWPVDSLLSYPSGIAGGLSTFVWLFICNNASRALIK